MWALLGTIVCKFGSDPATSVVEVAICAKFIDGRRTPRDCISSWNELTIKASCCVLTVMIIMSIMTCRGISQIVPWNTAKFAAEKREPWLLHTHTPFNGYFQMNPHLLVFPN